MLFQHLSVNVPGPRTDASGLMREKEEYLTPHPGNRCCTGTAERSEPVGHRTVPDVIAVIVNCPEPVRVGRDLAHAVAVIIADPGFVTGLSERGEPVGYRTMLTRILSGNAVFPYRSMGIFPGTCAVL